MTDQTPIKRAGNALLRNRAYQAGVAFGVPDEVEAEAKHRSEIVKAVLASIDLKELSYLLDDHKYSYYDDYSGHAVCECGWGEPEHSDHIALVVKNWLTGYIAIGAELATGDAA